MAKRGHALLMKSSYLMRGRIHRSRTSAQSSYGKQIGGKMRKKESQAERAEETCSPQTQEQRIGVTLGDMRIELKDQTSPIRNQAIS